MPLNVFDLSGLSLRYGARQALLDVDCSFRQGEFVAVVGPNGAGKSSLLSILAGLKHEYTGQCRFEGREVRQWARRDFARKVSFVPQSVRVDFPFTVEEVVAMGRTPFASGLFESEADRKAVEEALERTGLQAFRGRDARELSGGERQRVVLAAALAQQPQVLLLDEPATFLDLKHQLAIYRLLRELAGQGKLVVTVTHGLALAREFASRILVLQEGRLVSEGLTPAVFERVFEVDARRLL